MFALAPSRWFRALLFVPLLLVVAWAASDNAAYVKSVDDWRQMYESKLRADDGWLTVSGLFWLHEGKNTFGSAPGNDVVLPAPIPANAGYFELAGGKTTLHANPGSPITLHGKSVDTVELEPDSKTERLVAGDLTFFVHQSGGRYGIRLKDKNSKLRKEFAGLHWFPVDPAYHVVATFTLLPSPREVEVETVLGDREKLLVSGYVTFQLKGKEYRLEAEQDDPGSGLFIVFRDLTSKKETYPAARFVETDPPKDGKVEVDFNEAYNPPCAYNPYTTCPLPTPGNRMQIEIPAGEKRYH